MRKVERIICGAIAACCILFVLSFALGMGGNAILKLIPGPIIQWVGIGSFFLMFALLLALAIVVPRRGAKRK